MPSSTPLPPDAVSGVVRDEDGPVAGATVRVQATTNATLTDDEGRFTLTGLSEGVAVTVSAWNPTRVLSDNRLAAFSTDTSIYTFVAPAEGEVTVEVALLFRRAFKELMDQKGWDVPDILMEWEVITLSASQ